jgi:hypothetical protein
MALRASKPDPKRQKRLKVLLYGEPTTGKTTGAIQFPFPYILDCEHGTDQPEYADKINQAGGAVFHCPDIQSAIDETRALMSEQHKFCTLVVDAFTVIYQAEADRQEARVGTEYQKHLLEANKPTRRLFNLAMRLDMNFVVTCHAKAEWNDNKVTGTTWDGWKKMNYPFDLVLHLTKKKKERMATVVKTRLASFPDGDAFPMSFQEIAKRYPLAASEDYASTVTLASPEDIATLKRLVDLTKLAPETLQKWLAKAEADAIEDMPQDVITKCIDHLTQQLKTPVVSNNGTFV